jgi:hypothetical protein
MRSWSTVKANQWFGSHSWRSFGASICEIIESQTSCFIITLGGVTEQGRHSVFVIFFFYDDSTAPGG